MNGHHKAIRAQLAVMCQERAIDYLKAFHLPEDEENYIIDRELKKMSIIAIAEKYHVSKEIVINRRQSGFARIADAINYAKEKINTHEKSRGN